MDNSDDISLFNMLSYKNIIRIEKKWRRIIKDFNKDCNIYYQWIEPKICNLELFITFNKVLIIHEAKVTKKINITLNNFIPDKISNGVIKIVDNLLIYIETDEKLIPIKDQTFNINKSISKLSNQKFLDNAGEELVELEKIKLKDFKRLQAQKILNTYFDNFGIDFINLIFKFYSLEKIYWHIQYYRENNTSENDYSEEWFKNIYNIDITQEEVNYLLNL
jgi:hypothetical protein